MGLALVTFTGLLGVSLGIFMRLSGSPILDPLVGALVGLGFLALVGLGLSLALSLVHLLTRILTWKGFGAAAALTVVLLLLRLPPPLAIALGLGLAAVQGALGGAIALLSHRQAGRLSRRKRIAMVTLVVVGLAVNGAVVAWVLHTGSTDHLVAAPADPAPPSPLPLADPGLPGPFTIRALTYGNGTDRRRGEFAAGVDIVSPTVDATALVKGNDGFKRRARRWYWGFDYDAFPLNGRVWAPDGPGPYPLVLVVHGNHQMEEHSDPGYAYLGEHLASRGYITVSVDANFFNGSWSGSLDTENDGRAWLLLQHLALWREWTRDPDHPLAGLADLDRVALIGHSRGGEAAAIAGAFNRLNHYPDDATVLFDFGFGIRSIIAIAPSDGQYSPADQPTTLSDVNYLVLQGGHDADVSFFMGARQYERTTFSGAEYRFKASVYSYRSNHGQFNTVWGRHDAGRPISALLNTRPLLDGDDQRRLGTVFMTAFLEATLRDRLEYVELFRDHRRAAAWLPEEDILVTRFADSSRRVVADYSEDVDVTTATLPGAVIRGEGLAVWREGFLPLRKSSQRNPAVVLGWRATEGGVPPSYAMTLPAGAVETWGLTSDSLLTFAAAPSSATLPEAATTGVAPEGGGEAPHETGSSPDRPANAQGKDGSDRDGQAAKPPTFTIELRTSDDVIAALTSDEIRPLPPVLRSRFTKFWTEADSFGCDTEPVLQALEIPLRRFASRVPGFDPGRLREIRLVFDRSPAGVILLDDVAFAEPTPAE